MPTYVIHSKHQSDQCPTSSARVRAFVQKSMADTMRLAEEGGIRLVAGPYVMGSEHESLAVVEADRIEQVNEFAQRSGMIQWNTVRISPAMPMQEALGELDKMPPPLY